MKVRFTSPKERQPGHDGGLKVLYAPGKRAAFKLRWYLIVLLISSPFLWFMGKLITGWVWVDAPGQTHIPTIAIRAPDSARVAQLEVVEGDIVETGQQLVELTNPLWHEQKQQLQTQINDTRDSKLIARERRHLTDALERARHQLRQTRSLAQQSAATQSEVDKARDTVQLRERELITFNRSVADDRASNSQRFRDTQRELALVNARLQQLIVDAPAAGRVLKLHVNRGENVGAGTLMATLEKSGSTELWVFLSARHRTLAQPGQSLEVSFPDGYRLPARVASAPLGLERLPPTMRSGFQSNEPALFLKIRPKRPLPERWRLGQVPITAHFPSALERWLAH